MENAIKIYPMLPAISPVLFKVTAFVTRNFQQHKELLLFRHPNAGIQLPSGTVEEDELPEQAVLREVAEETGVKGARLAACLGYLDTQPSSVRFVLQKTGVYARPDYSSCDVTGFQFYRGTIVSLQHCEGEFAQVTYEEWDRFPDPQVLTCQVTGWVPLSLLSDCSRRFFYHLEKAEDSLKTRDLPGVAADNHIFYPFWAPLDALPELVQPQQEWFLKFFRI